MFSLGTHIRNDGRFALSSGKGIHLLVFHVVTFSLKQKACITELYLLSPPLIMSPHISNSLCKGLKKVKAVYPSFPLKNTKVDMGTTT